MMVKSRAEVENNTEPIPDMWHEIKELKRRVDELTQKQGCNCATTPPKDTLKYHCGRCKSPMVMGIPNCGECGARVITTNSPDAPTEYTMDKAREVLESNIYVFDYSDKKDMVEKTLTALTDAGLLRGENHAAELGKAYQRGRERERLQPTPSVPVDEDVEVTVYAILEEWISRRNKTPSELMVEIRPYLRTPPPADAVEEARRRLEKNFGIQGRFVNQNSVRPIIGLLSDLFAPTPSVPVDEGEKLSVWCPVTIATGEVDVSDVQPFDDELGELIEECEWREFTLVPPRTPPPKAVLEEARRRLEGGITERFIEEKFVGEVITETLRILSDLLTGRGKEWPTREEFLAKWNIGQPADSSEEEIAIWIYDHLAICATPRAVFPVTEEELQKWADRTWPNVQRGRGFDQAIVWNTYQFIRAKFEEQEGE